MVFSRLGFALGALGVTTLVTGVPTALADDTIACAPGQIVVNGQCLAPPTQDNTHPDNTGGTDSGSGSHGGGHGR
jgi:hypothetical protein